MLAGSTIETEMSHGAELDAEHVGERLERVLRGRVRPEETARRSCP